MSDQEIMKQLTGIASRALLQGITKGDKPIDWKNVVQFVIKILQIIMEVLF